MFLQCWKGNFFPNREGTFHLLPAFCVACARVPACIFVTCFPTDLMPLPDLSSQAPKACPSALAGGWSSAAAAAAAAGGSPRRLALSSEDGGRHVENRNLVAAAHGLRRVPKRREISSGKGSSVESDIVGRRPPKYVRSTLFALIAEYGEIPMGFGLDFTTDIPNYRVMLTT